MTVVLVHGNPECAAIWTPLIDALGRDDVVALSPPGFGVALPTGFEPTVWSYLEWLKSELTDFDEPVDLVGHDWGGAHVVNVAMRWPHLIRSWASDVVGMYDDAYTWHELAVIWQTPGVGEGAVAAMVESEPHDRAAHLMSLGMPADIAAHVAKAQDAAMGTALLGLYRSAPNSVLTELRRDLGRAAARPGLAIRASEDPYVGTEAMTNRAAAAAGATTGVLTGVGHWWMLEDPSAGAELLSRFWSRDERPSSIAHPGPASDATAGRQWTSEM